MLKRQINQISEKIKFLKNHSGFVKYFKNTFWIFGGEAFRTAISLFVGLWLARYLGPDRLGLFVYAQSLAAIFTVVTTSGLNGILVRELVKNKFDQRILLGTALGIKLLGSFFIILLVIVAINFTTDDTQTKILILILVSSVIFDSFNITYCYFEAKVLSKYIVYANSSAIFISSIIRIVFILQELSLVAFTWVILFERLLTVMGIVYFFFKKSTISMRSLKFKRKMAFSLLKDCWPEVLGVIILTIQVRIDQVMLKDMMNNTEVGYYSAALKIVSGLGVITAILNKSLYPSIEGAKKESSHFYNNRLLNYYRLNFLLFLLMVIPIYIFSEPIILLLFGIEYQVAGGLLALMSGELFFINVQKSRASFMLSENLLRFSMLTTALGVGINIVLNLLLIPKYGAKGAIMATLISYFLSLFFVDLFYLKTRKNLFLQFKSIYTFYKINLRNKSI